MPLMNKGRESTAGRIAMQSQANGYIKKECNCNSRGIGRLLRELLMKYQVEIKIQKSKTKNNIVRMLDRRDSVSNEAFCICRIHGGVGTRGMTSSVCTFGRSHHP